MTDPVLSIFGEAFVTESAADTPGAPDISGTLRLFVGDTVPTRDSVAADFTEATFSGYLPFTLVAGNWSNATLLTDRARVKYLTDPIAWTWATDGEEVNGWYILAPTLDLVAAQRFDDPHGGTGGQTLNLTLYLSGRGG